MKVLMKMVDMLCLMGCDGHTVPVKFKFPDENGEPCIIRIDRVISCREEKIAGNRMQVYRVEGDIAGSHREFEMKFEFHAQRWYLYKL